MISFFPMATLLATSLHFGSHSHSLTFKYDANFNTTLILADTFPAMPDSFLAFAKSLSGTPYLYASTDPQKGFDCSGFITYVFNHFGIKVPRSSIDFTHYGSEIEETMVKPGDLVLFTGTDSSIRTVGHMGIVVEANSEGIQFIHSTSGKAYGVTTTPLNKYYRGRLVKFIRVFSFPA